MMRKCGALVAVAAMFSVSVPTQAAVNCRFQPAAIETYEHGGVYAHGTLSNGDGSGARWVGFIILCGGTGPSQGPGNTATNCDSKATDRNYSLTLAAFTQKKTLLLNWQDRNSCAEIVNYSRPYGIQLADAL
jgi:hypothetical protein